MSPGGKAWRVPIKTANKVTTNAVKHSAARPRATINVLKR